MPAQTVMRLVKSPAPMYKPTAWRSKGGLHVPTSRNAEQTRQPRSSFPQSTRCLSLLKAEYQSRSTRATTHQNNSNMTRAFSRVKREANLKSLYRVWQNIVFTVLSLAKAEKDHGWGKQHDLQDTSILGRQKQLLVSELEQTYTCEPAEPYQNSMHCVTRVSSPAHAQLPKGFPRSAGFEPDSVNHLWCKSSHNFCQ